MDQQEMDQQDNLKKRTTFCPGKIWTDTEGKRIQAHGGSLFLEDGIFYWYGENKEYTCPGNGILQWGVRYYASRDLYNWQDEGLLIPPEPENMASLLHPSSKAERPHIIFCEKTGKYVCWMKVIRGVEQLALVLTADRFRGPYSIIKNGFRPLGMCMGDFDLLKEQDGRAFCLFEKPHTELICAELTEDYTDMKGPFSSHLAKGQPPFVREAPACFKRQGRYYLLTSGTTGYYPNPTEAASAEHIMGPFTELGRLHPEDSSCTSYGSQISSVFQYPGKEDCYIALADRWMPQLRSLAPKEYDAGITYGKIHRNFLWAHGKDRELAGKVKWTLPQPDTSCSDYVWLPITFQNEKPVIYWQDEWKL